MTGWSTPPGQDRMGTPTACTWMRYCHQGLDGVPPRQDKMGYPPGQDRDGIPPPPPHGWVPPFGPGVDGAPPPSQH